MISLRGAVATILAIFAMKMPSKPTRTAIGEYIAETGFYQSILINDDNDVSNNNNSDSPTNRNNNGTIRKRSKFQLIEVVRSNYYGKILVLDGVVQLTEKDADSYNEMMSHPAMFAHSNPQRVLIIGGGDGYVLSEVLKHSSVKHVDHVDLDEQVIQVCKDHFSWGKAWDDPRVTLHIADGSAFVKNVPSASYDVIIQDSSDPFTWGDDGEKIDLPSKTLYENEHFGNIERALSKQGIFNFQAETFNIESDLQGIVEWRKQALEVGFQDAKYGSLTISSYPTGQIGFLLCVKDKEATSSLPEIERRYKEMTDAGGETSYYHPQLQVSSFILPLWVEKRIYS